MVKKSILAIAILAMLATVTMAQDPQTQVPGQFKTDGRWPMTCNWTKVTICCIKINLKIGYFIEIDNCANLKIDMVQVNCISPQTFPCYKGCSTIKVRSNFEAQLGLGPVTPVGNIINGSKAKAYFEDVTGTPTGQDTWIVAGDGNFHDVKVCVEAWDANIFFGTPGQNPQVGTVCITAMPTAAAVCP